MKKIVYLGNMTGVAGILTAQPGSELIAWIAEKEDLADPIFKAIFEKNGVPFYAVSGAAELSEVLKKIPRFDLGVIANFGIILSAEDLKAAKKGFVNIHPGLLPEYPGRYPIQKVIASQDLITGVTLHRATEAVDAGPVIEKRVTAMPKDRQMAEVFQRLEVLACRILEDRLGELIL